MLVREEIELAKAEVTEKATKLVKGAIVGIAAGVFFVMALVFALVGCAWLLYYYLPGNEFTYFWGFFAMAVILVVLGALAGLLAAKAVKRGAPPVPTMAIEEARKIRETVSSGSARAPGAPAPTDRRVPAAAAGAGGLMAQRTPAEIRNSIEANRMELAVSLDRLRGEVAHITDWRGHVERHRARDTSGAAVVGLALGVRIAAPPPPPAPRPLAPRLQLEQRARHAADADQARARCRCRSPARPPR